MPRAGSGWRQRQAWDQGSCLCLTTGPALCSRGCLTLVPSLCEFCSDGTPSPWTSLTSGVVLLLSPGPAWSPCSRGALIPGLPGPVSGLLQRADPGRGCRPTCHPQCCCEWGVSFVSYWARLGRGSRQVDGPRFFPSVNLLGATLCTAVSSSLLCCTLSVRPGGEVAGRPGPMSSPPLGWAQC